MCRVQSYFLVFVATFYFVKVKDEPYIAVLGFSFYLSLSFFFFFWFLLFLHTQYIHKNGSVRKLFVVFIIFLFQDQIAFAIVSIQAVLALGSYFFPVMSCDRYGWSCHGFQRCSSCTSCAFWKWTRRNCKNQGSISWYQGTEAFLRLHCVYLVHCLYFFFFFRLILKFLLLSLIFFVLHL